MKALFVANLEIHPTEGIYKKILAQSEALGEIVGECDLVIRSGKNAFVKKQSDQIGAEKQIAFLEYVKKEIENNSIACMYIRHMIPSLKLISVLKVAKNKGIRIFYEIPTYPYFTEQYRSSKKKYRAIAKISLDILFWPYIYKYIDKLVVIRSKSKAKHFKKMVEITNGVDIDKIAKKDYSKSKDQKVIRLVAVGTIYPYHGYDRLLMGLAECNEKVKDIIIELHVIGASDTIEDLQDQANTQNLKHVFFHGVKTTEELNEMYDAYDIGVGCLALHRRNADIDTTLKIIEYYCRGLPVITSGISPMDEEESCTIHICDNEEAIDISEIVREYESIEYDVLCKISEIACEKFSWKSIMKKVYG